MTVSGKAFEPPVLLPSYFEVGEGGRVHPVGPDDLGAGVPEVDVHSVDASFVLYRVVEPVLTLVPLRFSVHHVDSQASPVGAGVGHGVGAATGILGRETPPTTASAATSPGTKSGTASLRG